MTNHRRHGPFGSAAFAAALSACVACGTSGQDWVAETPRTARSAAPTTEASAAEVAAVREQAAVQEQASRESENGLPQAPDASDASEGPERRVITLGESYAAPPTPESSAEAPDAVAAAEASVQINNYYGYGGTGYYYPYYGGRPYGAPDTFRDRAGSPPARRTVQPGQDWPSVPSYGPAFPYKTAPASPWAP